MNNRNNNGDKPMQQGGKNGDHSKNDDGGKEFKHNTPHESQPEKAGKITAGKEFPHEDVNDYLDDQEESRFDADSEQLIQRNTGHKRSGYQQRDQRPQQDTTRR